jgi:RNA polymerase sigma-70 factor (ECF subfamily)
VRDFYRKKRIQNFFNFSGLNEDTLPSQQSANQETPAAIQNITKQDFWKQVDNFLDHLSKMEREVFLLKYLDQLRIAEISRVLERSESTVKTHLYRALVKFKNASSIIQCLREDLRE